MTDYENLMDEFAEAQKLTFSERHKARAALKSAIEALAAENERLKRELEISKLDAKEWYSQADALQAKLDAMGKGEPVANSELEKAVWTVLEGWTIPAPVRKILETAYYAAPKALEEQEPREQRADWLPIANALDHAVMELGRTKEANAHDWNTAVHVFEFARATTCTCCSSPTQWPAAYRCLDCKAVLCETCAPIHFGPDHSKRAAEAHKGN